MRLPFTKRERAPERKFLLADDWPWGIPFPTDLAETVFTTEQAFGLPVVAAAVRLLAGSFAQTPTLVYRNGRDGVRERATDSDAWRLLHDGVGTESAPSSLRGDVAASLAANGNAYLRKITVRGVVRDLILLDPRRVQPRREGGRIVYRDSTSGTPVDRDRSEIVHVRTFAVAGSLEGVGPIEMSREALSTALSRQRFERRFVKNDARPPAIISFPTAVTEDQAKAWIAAWEEQHKGPENAGNIGVIGGGAELKSIPLSNLDALFVEATALTLRQGASLFCIPPSLLGDREHEASETDRLLYVQNGLGPLVRAFDDALTRDPDICPPGSGLYVETLTDGLLRTDTKSRYEAFKAARQGGWITANEIRARENLPPVPGGDELQLTPVGGAPNPRD